MFTSEDLIRNLADRVAKLAPEADDHQTNIAGLSIHRRNAPSDPLQCVYPLSLAVTLQGIKQVATSESMTTYGPGQSMLTALEEPLITQVLEASPRKPYFGLLLRLEPSEVLLTAAELEIAPQPMLLTRIRVSIESTDEELLDALRRLVSLATDRIHQNSLEPLIKKEIAIRLLTGNHGTNLRQLIRRESPSEHISRTVVWMKRNYAASIRVDDLAAQAGMSPSAFRKHFRIQVGESPVQFQKKLRLQKARQLMLNRGMDASRAATTVGYESPSQFSREYRRQFGAPPHRDVRNAKAIPPD